MHHTTRPALRLLRRRAAPLCAAALAATAAVAVTAPAAQAARQHVDIYSALLELKVDQAAQLKEDGWSQVKTDTIMNGVVHARIDNLTFVDGVPQSTPSTAFTSMNATELHLDQDARYTSPEGSDSGHCDESSRETVPLENGQIGMSLGALDDAGRPQVSVGITSPNAVWIYKTCTGYLAHEVADPLLLKPVFVHRYVPVADIGTDFTIAAGGHLECPNFIRIFHCDPAYEMTVEFKRTDSFDRGEPDAPLPVPPAPPVPGDHATDAEIDAFHVALMVRMARQDRYGQAVVRCGRPCQGQVSAYAVWLSKQGTPKGTPKKLGTTTFKSDTAGQAAPTVKLSGAQRKIAKGRGAIEFRAEATPVGGGAAKRSSQLVRVGR